MPKRAISTDKVFRPSLPFAQATEAGGFVFACSTGRDVEGRFAIGDVRLKVVKTITRCAAINVDPDTAARDLELPSVLTRRLGRNECGIFAEVMAGGTIGIGDQIVVE